MRRTLLLLTTITMGVLLASGVALAVFYVKQTFSNTSPILIRDATLGPARDVPRSADPYPSEITVSGFNQGSIRKVGLILKGFTHSHPDDVGVLLVGPQGQNALVMSDVGGRGDVSRIRLRFLDRYAESYLPDDPWPALLTSGTFHPTQGTDAGGGFPVPVDFPSPAPLHPYGTDLSVFNGTDPNGIWKLYVLDDSDVHRGEFRGGWSLGIRAIVQP